MWYHPPAVNAAPVSLVWALMPDQMVVTSPVVTSNISRCLSHRERGRKQSRDRNDTTARGSGGTTTKEKKVQVVPKSALVGRDGRRRRTAAAVASTKLVDKYYNSDEDENEEAAPQRAAARESSRIRSRAERAEDRRWGCVFARLLD